jgi:uncharacterized protein YjbJ (UPF0337 family)
MKNSKKDQVGGKARELKGRIKEKMGRALNNREMEEKGRLERAGGRIRKKIGDVEQVFED